MAVLKGLAKEVTAAVIRHIHSSVYARGILAQLVAAKRGKAGASGTGGHELGIRDKRFRIVREAVLPGAVVAVVQEQGSGGQVRLELFVIIAHLGIAGGIDGAETALAGGVENVVVELGSKEFRLAREEEIYVRQAVIHIEYIVVNQAVVSLKGALHLDEVRMVVFRYVVAGDILKDVVHKQHKAVVVL